MESVADRKKRVRKILRVLAKTFPDVKCPLNYSNPLELLVATILSAQCTDARVNMESPKIFAKYQTARDFAEAPREDLESLFKSCGTFRRKAIAVQEACRALAEHHNGEVPADIEVLSKLPGIGRKTANVVLGNAFGIPSIMVDTHVLRLSGRLGLASAHNVEKKYAAKVERELLEIVPKKDGTLFSHVVGALGRTICVARKPKCPECPVAVLCPYPEKTEG